VGALLDMGRFGGDVSQVFVEISLSGGGLHGVLNSSNVSSLM